MPREEVADSVEYEARRGRAALLRSFEDNKLTTANFCALKRITEADLQVQLAQARQERELRSQALRSEGRADRSDRGPDRGPDRGR